MSISAYLYSEATAKIMRAGRCRSVADMLDLRRAALTERHQPVVTLHTEDVWRGRAATASRTRLRRVIGAALNSFGLDLATTARALRDEGSRLEQEAAALRRKARVLAEAEAEARARTTGAAALPARIPGPFAGVSPS